jgi:HAD superfamily hydrolase (TIGR01490 family)
MSGRAAAFFDFDKTLVEAETSKLIVRYLWDHPKIMREKRVDLFYLFKLFIINEIYMLNLYSDVKMSLLMIEFFKGRDRETFEKAAPDLYGNYIKPKLSPTLLAVLEEHRKLKHALVLISGGIRYPLEPAMKDLGFHHLRCTELEVGTDGLLTGRPVDNKVCIRDEKRTVINKFAYEQGIDLSASYAYGNHESDIPMLDLVGHPIAVTPTGRLRKIARKRGWPIIEHH